MNREIKFRGKRKDNGEWVYGYFYLSHEMPKRGDIGYFIKINLNETYEVVGETVGQFTELTDKNGSEIYEGDILERVGTKDIFMSGNIFIYADPTTKTREFVELKVSSNEFGTTFFGFSLNTQKTYSERNEPATYEIIGNIYQNPELLNQ